MTREEALKVVKDFEICFPNEVSDALEVLIPELTESEDEKILDVIVHFIKELPDNQVYFLDNTTKPVRKSDILAYLEKQKEKEGYEAIPVESTLEYKLGFKAGKESEKQKEQQATEPSDEELQRHQDELYDFKVFVTKQAREHHISFSFVHDFEWNNFCAELLSYFNEQKPDEIDGKALLHVSNKSYDIGFRDGVASVRPAEWNEEDKEMFRIISNRIEKFDEWATEKGYSIDDPTMKQSPIAWLKSLPERFNLQPKVEWNDADEALYNAFICEVISEKMDPTIEEIKWLRGIRDRLKSFSFQPKQELNEDDERIRKEIIGYLQLVGKGDGDYAQPMVDKWIAYLEKWNEQKISDEYIRLNSKELNTLLAEQYDKGFWKGKNEKKTL